MTAPDLPPLFLARNRQVHDQALAALRDGLLACPVADVLALWDAVLETNKATQASDSPGLTKAIAAYAVVGLCGIILSIEKRHHDDG